MQSNVLWQIVNLNCLKSSNLRREEVGASTLSRFLDVTKLFFSCLVYFFLLQFSAGAYTNHRFNKKKIYIYSGKNKAQFFLISFQICIVKMVVKKKFEIVDSKITIVNNGFFLKTDDLKCLQLPIFYFYIFQAKLFIYDLYEHQNKFNTNIKRSYVFL